MIPPWQPWSTLSQSTSCCSDSTTKSLPASFSLDSRVSMVLKAQQLPHCSWFLTGVSTPDSFLQSFDAGAAPVGVTFSRSEVSGTWVLSYYCLNSSSVRSARLVMPMV